MKAESTTAPLQICEEDFLKFQEFFYRKTGIQFESTKRYFVDKRLLERIDATNSVTFRNYFTKLRFQASGEEIQALTNLMTVNETYFFREEHQFKCMVESLLPEITAQKKPGTTLRIWSMPSSSGEEAYSIAIYLSEFWAGLAQWDVEIISSDIDTRILGQARQGLYGDRSLMHMPPGFLKKYFRRTQDGYQIIQDIREAVEFTRVNLMEPADTRPYRNFDLIFCRNLLIYFDEISRKTAAETFYDAMAPGGFICLGHSESMSRISSIYQIRRFPQAIVYQKQREAR